MFHLGQIQRQERYPPSRRRYVGISDPHLHAENQTASTSLARDPRFSLPYYAFDKERSFKLSAIPRNLPSLLPFEPAA